MTTLFSGYFVPRYLFSGGIVENQTGALVK